MKKPTHKSISKDFIPFTHQELEVKNALVDEARRLRNENEFSMKLASAMIYASIAEYLADHLLENLRFFVYRTTYVDFAGIVFIDERGDGGGKTLGAIVSLLQKFEFPDKKDILDILSNVTTHRNQLFHNLAKTSVIDFPNLENSIKQIQDDTEQFIDKINVVYAGLQKILVTQPPAQEANQNN